MKNGQSIINLYYFLQNFLLLDENVPLTQSSLTVKGISIAMKNINASWTTTAIVNTLHNINIQIKERKLYAIVGPIGAGKVHFTFVFHVSRVIFYMKKINLIFI